MAVPIQPVKQWIQRKRKHYKLATCDYVVRLHESLSRDTKQKLERLDSRSLVVRIESHLLLDSDGNKRSLHGITLDSCHLPDVRLNERVLLVQLATNRPVASGYVCNLSGREVKIRLDKSLVIEDQGDDDDDAKKEYRVIFDQQHVVERQRQIENALRKFKNITCSLPIHKCVLGKYQDWSNTKYGRARAMQLTGLAAPKGLQVLAVEESMKKRISLIEGVSGSGKTLVAANIAYSMSRLRKRKVIICSPIQATVDRLAKMLDHTKEVNVVQLSAGRLSNDDIFSKYSTETLNNNKGDQGPLLDELVRNAVYLRGWKRLAKQIDGPNQAFIYEAEQSRLRRQATRLVENCSPWLKRKLERKVLHQADIVCCTLIQAGYLYGQGLYFDMLIIDDVHVATEADCMVPMMLKGLKQVTLLSDMRREIRLARSHHQPKQLPASNDIQTSVTGSNQVSSRNILRKARGTTRTSKQRLLGNKRRNEFNRVADQAQELGGLFERWLAMGLSSVALNHQFRMHETLAAFTNHHFYLSRLKTDTKTNGQLADQIQRPIKPEQQNDDCLSSSASPTPSHSETTERFDWLPNSRCITALFDTLLKEDLLNDTVRDIIQKLTVREGVLESRIGIITNVRAYRESIGGIQVGTVEDFFGQEKDFIILSCIDSLERANGYVEKKQNNGISSSEIDYNYLLSDSALSIAITRARLGLFIVADLKNLAGQDVDKAVSLEEEMQPMVNYCKSWRNLVKYYVANKLVAC